MNAAPIIIRKECPAMATWRPFQEFSFRGLHFCSNGTIDMAGLEMPQSAGITDCDVNGVHIEKPNGAGEVVTLEADGKTAEFKYERGQWWGRSDSVGFDESPPPPAPSQMPLGPSAPRPRVSRAAISHAWPLLAVIAVGGTFTLTALYIARNPLSDLVNLLAKGQRIHATEVDSGARREEDSARRLQMESRTAEVIDHGRGQLQVAERDRDRLEHDFIQATHNPLPALASGRLKPPREIDLAILEEAPFRQAWNDVLNAYIASCDVSSVRNSMTRIEQNLLEHHLSEADALKMEDLARDVARWVPALEGQAPNLLLIRETLARRQLNELNQKQQRSH
ncbi:MAG: hypothetical protein HY287_03970 [Planctomycetes bacterium]|nr:hypothetical protein [Planctomycetota bacterium]